MNTLNLIHRFVNWGGAVALAASISVSLANATDFAPIDVTMNVAELAISHEETILRNQAVMALANGETIAVRCAVTFRNGPEKPIERKVVLQPTDEKVVSAPIRRGVTRMQIDVSCQKAE